jgi:phytoene dehydrogenase-like protein
MHRSHPAPTDEVLILGAGPAGLATALFAARRGLRVAVIERGAAVGGLTRSETIDGVRVDLGSHRLHPAAPAPVLKTLTELLGDDLQLRPRNGRVRIAERWVGFRSPCLASP